jgi:hypothetical protein
VVVIVIMSNNEEELEEEEDQQGPEQLPLKDEFSSDLSEIDLADYADRQDEQQANPKAALPKPKRKRILKGYRWKQKWVNSSPSRSASPTYSLSPRPFGYASGSRSSTSPTSTRLPRPTRTRRATRTRGLLNWRTPSSRNR